jgi:hypothetical protein
MGPGTTADDRALLAATAGTLGGRLCFAPETWATRIPQLVGDHLPRLVGGKAAPLQDDGVLTGVSSGQNGLQLWVGTITMAGLAAGAWYWWAARSGRREAPASHLGGYLVLVGTISTLVYGFLACSHIGAETMRDNLLGLLFPVGALVMAIQAWRHPAVRAGFAAAVALWCLFNALDVVALTREYWQHRPEDRRQQTAAALEARGVQSARSAYRVAYHVTFLAQERVRVAAIDYSRIRAYVEEADRVNAPTLSDLSCDGGEPLPSGQFLCPAQASEAARR